MDVAVDLIALAWDGVDWKVLLIERRFPPYQGAWALPGGFVDEGEDLAVAAKRELLEETGVPIEYITQVGAFGKPDRDPRKRVISVSYVAILHEMVPARAGDDAAKAEWFATTDLPDLAFDHRMILQAAIQTIQNQYKLENFVQSTGPLKKVAVEALKDLSI